MLVLSIKTCDKMHLVETHSCPDCNGDGYLYAEQYDQNGSYFDYVRCLACRGTGERDFCDECNCYI